MGGFQLSREAAAKTARVVKRLENAAPSQRAATPPAAGRLVALIGVTSTTTTENRYPAQIRDLDPATGSTSVYAGCWAISASGRALRVQRYYGVLVGFRAADGLPIFQVIDAYGPLTVAESDSTPTITNARTLTFNSNHFTLVDAGSGSVSISGRAQPTISELDGSPSYALTDLRVNQADGLTINLGGPDLDYIVLNIADASDTQAGIVSLGDQTMGTGVKTFEEIDCGDATFLGVIAESVTAGSVVGTDVFGIQVFSGPGVTSPPSDWGLVASGTGTDGEFGKAIWCGGDIYFPGKEVYIQPNTRFGTDDEGLRILFGSDSTSTATGQIFMRVASGGGFRMDIVHQDGESAVLTVNDEAVLTEGDGIDGGTF